MRRVVMVVALLGCNSKLEGTRVDSLAFPHCSIAVPAGWNVVERPDTPPATRVLVLDHAVEGFAPSIIVQEVEMGEPDHELVFTATDEFCRDVVQKTILTQTGTDPGFARAIRIGRLRGCDVEMLDKTTAQSGRQISLSDGKLTVSLVCNRDKHPPPGVDVDGACDAFARAITPK
jgi:hypothetical protein